MAAAEVGDLKPADLDHIICHQANLRIVANVAHQLRLPMERFENNIGELGNTGSAGVALVFSQRRDSFARGERVGLTVFGGGYSCGAAIIEM